MLESNLSPKVLRKTTPRGRNPGNTVYIEVYRKMQLDIQIVNPLEMVQLDLLIFFKTTWPCCILLNIKSPYISLLIYRTISISGKCSNQNAWIEVR